MGQKQEAEELQACSFWPATLQNVGAAAIKSASLPPASLSPASCHAPLSNAWQPPTTHPLPLLPPDRLSPSPASCKFLSALPPSPSPADDKQTSRMPNADGTQQEDGGEQERGQHARRQSELLVTPRTTLASAAALDLTKAQGTFIGPAARCRLALPLLPFAKEVTVSQKEERQRQVLRQLACVRPRPDAACHRRHRRHATEGCHVVTAIAECMCIMVGPLQSCARRPMRNCLPAQPTLASTVVSARNTAERGCVVYGVHGVRVRSVKAFKNWAEKGLDPGAGQGISDSDLVWCPQTRLLLPFALSRFIVRLITFLP